MSTIFPQIGFAAKIQFFMYKIEFCDKYSNFKDSSKNNFPGNTISEKMEVQSMKLKTFWTLFKTTYLRGPHFYLHISVIQVRMNQGLVVKIRCAMRS